MGEKVSNGKLNTRDRALDGAKGVAILIVMLGHCIVLNGLDQGDPILYDAIASIQMPLFMLISGMAAAIAGLSFVKLKKRAVAYLVPFFSWFVISYFWARIRSGIRGAGDESVSPLSVSGFLGELKDLLFQTDRGLWFLMTLFVVTCCMTIATACGHFVVSAMKNRKTNGTEAEDSGKGTKSGNEVIVILTVLGCMLVLYGLFFIQGRVGNTFLSPSLTIKYMPFYVLGYLWQELRTKYAGNAETGPLILYILCLIGFAFFVIKYPLTMPAESLRDFALLMTASLLGTVAVFGLVYMALTHFGKGKEKGFLSFIGTYTLEIYVLHFRFARLLGIDKKGLTLWSVSGILWCLAAFLLMAVLTAVSVFVLSKIPVCRFLLFGKSSSRSKDLRKRDATT